MQSSWRCESAEIIPKFATVTPVQFLTSAPGSASWHSCASGTFCVCARRAGPLLSTVGIAWLSFAPRTKEPDRSEAYARAHAAMARATPLTRSQASPDHDRDDRQRPASCARCARQAGKKGLFTVGHTL